MTRYTHDCSQCKPLGTYNEYDLYFCEQNGVPIVIARFVPDGWYLSGMSFAARDPLKEARERAIAAGFISNTTLNEVKP